MMAMDVPAVRCCVVLILSIIPWSAASAEIQETLTVRGKPQTLHLYGPPGGDPAIVSSGDGGWIHLGPEVAQILAGRGFFVVGFDSKAYLQSFTSRGTTVHEADVPGDYRALIAFAGHGSRKKPLLVGISEGAGLSVLAAAAGTTRPLVAGVIALGLGDVNELGWRWKDAVIYVTHGVPNEPTFRVSTHVRGVAPAPLALINSTRDEYVPAPDIDRILASAQAPKRLWMIDAADHRFSDQQPALTRDLAEAVAWVQQNGSR